jgi:hypothetical protein
MTSTRTSTTVHTRTHTATHLTEVIMGTIADILGDLGIDLTRLYRDWAQDEKAISAWIEEGSLETVVLECHRPDGKVNPIFEFPVSYDVGGRGDVQFVESRAALARYRTKLARVPAGTAFQLVCAFNGSRTPQTGWGPGSRASTDALTAMSFGTLAEGPHAKASLRYLR